MRDGITGQTTNTEAPGKAYAADAASNRLRNDDHAAHLRKQLYDRQWKLERDLQEVKEAITILDTDETVNKVLKVFGVAAK